MKPEDRQIYSVFWNLVENYSGRLANLVGRGPFDVVVGVGAGGIIPAALVARKVAPEAVFQVIRARTYTDEGEETPGVAILDMNMVDLSHMKDKHILIVDDIVDRGRTLGAIVSYVRQQGPASIVTATLFARNKNQVDHVIEVTDRWVRFPWERQKREGWL